MEIEVGWCRDEDEGYYWDGDGDGDGDELPFDGEFDLFILEGNGKMDNPDGKDKVFDGTQRLLS